MKKVYVIGSADAGDKNDASAMAKAIKVASVVQWEDLIFEISRGEVRVIDKASGADIKDAGLVLAVNWYKSGQRSIYKDVAFALALYLKHHGVKFWNSEMLMQRSTTKLTCMMQLALNGYDVPATVFSLSCQNLTDKANAWPIIIKAAAASRGRQNYLLKDIGELKERLSEQVGPNGYLLQEFIPNDSDLRIVCFDSEPCLVVRRSRTDDNTHLNNTSSGADAELVDLGQLPQSLKYDCKAICKIMGREMAGIDLMRSNDGLSRQVFLEVNAIPQLTSGAFISQKLEALAAAVNAA